MKNQWRAPLGQAGLRNPCPRSNEGLWDKRREAVGIEARALFDAPNVDSTPTLKLNNYLRVRVADGMSTGERIK